MQPHKKCAKCIKNAFVQIDSMALRHCKALNQRINFDPLQLISEKRASFTFPLESSAPLPQSASRPLPAAHAPGAQTRPAWRL